MISLLSRLLNDFLKYNIFKKTITINNVDKDILTIHIIIGNSTKTLMDKQIDYTLKYW